MASSIAGATSDLALVFAFAVRPAAVLSGLENSAAMAVPASRTVATALTPTMATTVRLTEALLGGYRAGRNRGHRLARVCRRLTCVPVRWRARALSDSSQ